MQTVGNARGCLYQLGKGSRVLVLLLVTLLAAFSALAGAQSQANPVAQNQDQESQPNAGQPADEPVTLFPHPDTRFWISGEINIIFQAHPDFPAKYSGPNSLHSSGEHATSRLLTLYTGLELTHGTALLFDVESASGRGISDALGLAGFTNVDVVRNPTLGGTPYVARVMLHQIIPLSSETTETERGPLSLFSRLPVRRLELRAGRFSMADFFDTNDVGSDSHLQFTNWTSVNNGAYDYAADTRGYTYGVIADYEDRKWGLKFAEALMPTVANGLDLQWNLRKAHAENLEASFFLHLLKNRHSTLRLLSFVNHANMGVYRQAVVDFLEHKTPVPDITAHPEQVTVKYGFGVNLEQELTGNLRGYARWGWNEGQHESYAYTEVDSAVAFGVDYRGERWRRKLDKVGATFVSNGIGADHQHYLELGGRGFLLGDGTLTYGRETIVESYYNVHIWRGLFAAFDLQHINNPGYNRDRGPVLVPGLRLHLDL